MAAEDVFGIVGTTQAGNFRVEKVVAEGGFAVVYRAQHGGFRAPVAIKCLKIPEQMTPLARDTFLEKFREEAELMFRLSAAITEICRPLHVDVLHLADGRFVPFLALEWLEGESLDGIITRRREQRQPPLGLHKVVKMMRPVAAALAKAHHFPGPDGAVAIIHRDLKPENLFVANIHGSETMKILDFGIAKAKRAATQAVGRVTGHAVAEDEMASFTPAYGAPEQWVPKTWGETGPWTDVWGLALSMTEALCGAPPLDGDPWAMRRACLDEKHRPTPRHHGADVPAPVEEVFAQALALDPRKRFKTVVAFWTALEGAMGLPPSLGPRDDRCEPADGAGVPAAAHEQDAGAAAVLAANRERLARIEARKLNAAPAPPSRPSGGGGPPRAQPLPAGEPSGEWELDLAAAAPPSAPRSGRPGSADLEMQLPTGPSSTRNPISARGPVSTRPQAGPPRRANMELELSLPSRSDPPPSGGSWEVSLPTRSQPPPADPGGPRSEPRPRAVAAPPPSPAPAPAPAPAATAPRPAPPPPPPADLDFDLGVPSPQPASPQRAPPPAGDFAPAPRAPAAFDPARPPPRPRQAERAEVSARLRAPLGVLLLALAVASSEIGYHRLTGDDLAFGGVRPFYIAAPLALIGVGFTLWRLMEDRDDA